jgi:hypothetical protein
MSFVSPISDTTHNKTAPNASRLRRLSTYLKNAVTLEDTETAARRESVISDRGNAQREASRRSSITSLQDEQEDRALLAWRRGGEEGFWRKYGSVSSVGERRKSSVVNGEGEMRRRSSVGEKLEGKWRKMSWNGKGSV